MITQSPPARQLPLPISFVPDVVREHGLQEAHAKPLVSNGKGHRTHRRHARLAWGWAEIELRTPNSHPCILLDVDTDVESVLNVALGSAAVRVPNWVATNPATGHSHVSYCLARPVLFGAGMRLGPLQYHARVCEYYRKVYSADSGYNAVLTHNPVHPKWHVSFFRDAPWTLPELAEPIPKGWRIPAKPTTAEGRNVTLFQSAMRWFGRPSNWDASKDLGDVLAWIEKAYAEWYGEDPREWHRNESVWIAKSVTRYCRANLASGRTQTQLSLIQSARGKKGGKVSGVVRRKGSIEEAAPWELEGISRRAWHNHQAGEHTGQHGGARR